MSNIYDGNFNFDCFFKDLKTGIDNKSLLSFYYLNYTERENCKSFPTVSNSPLIDPPIIEGTYEGPIPSIDNLFIGKLYKDKFLQIDDENGKNESIRIFEKNISQKKDIIDPTTVESFGIGEMTYVDNGKAIVRGLSIYFKGGRTNKALYLLLTYTELKKLLDYLTYSYQEVSITSAKEWFKNKLNVHKDNPNQLAVLYEFLPLEFLDDLEYDNEFFKKQIYILKDTNNFKAVLNFIKLWLSFDSDSLYEFLNTDLITFQIYIKFTEEYGDRKEIGEYVAILTIIHGLYAENHKIPSKIFDMPINEEFLFEADAMISSGVGKFRVKTYTEEKRLWAYTPDRNYRETKLFRPLETLTYRVTVDADELDSQSVAFAQKIPGTNQVVFFADVPAIFFFYQYEEEYVKYINRGRVEFAINAITSIANIGITKAIISPSSKIVFRFAIAEIIFESLHKAINNPIVTSQLQQSVAGSHFLYIWNNYVAAAGNTIFILHGFAELLISLGKSKKVIEAIAKSGDPQAVKNLAKLTENGTKTLRSALNLSDDAVKVLRNKGWRLVVDRKNIRVEDYIGKVFAKLRPDDVNAYLAYWKLTRIDQRNALKKVFLSLKNSKNRYKSSRALKNGYEIPRTTNGGKTCGDFAETAYLFDHPKSIVRIKLSGSQDLDEKLAFESMGLTDKNVMDEILEKYTWHHMDDMDENLKCTMQLVETSAHKGISLHVGAVRQFEKLIGIKYIR